MFSETFYPVAEPDSVPKVYRRYNYQHLPPPSDPAQLMPDLRRGLRGAEKATFWGKVKSIGRRLRRECSSNVHLFRAMSITLTTFRSQIWQGQRG